VPSHCFAVPNTGGRDLVRLAARLSSALRRGDAIAVRRLAVCLALETLTFGEDAGFPVWDRTAARTIHQRAGHDLWQQARILVIGSEALRPAVSLVGLAALFAAGGVRSDAA
jgi:hypothetical protein